MHYHPLPRPVNVHVSATVMIVLCASRAIHILGALLIHAEKLVDKE